MCAAFLHTCYHGLAHICQFFNLESSWLCCQVSATRAMQRSKGCVFCAFPLCSAGGLLRHCALCYAGKKELSKTTFREHGSKTSKQLHARPLLPCCISSRAPEKAGERRVRAFANITAPRKATEPRGLYLPSCAHDTLDPLVPLLTHAIREPAARLRCVSSRGGSG